MVGALPPITTDLRTGSSDLPKGPTGLATVPLPRRPLDPSEEICPREESRRWYEIRRWYENDLGWPTVPARPEPAATPGVPACPVRLRVGPRFDVLEVPAEAGRAALRHLAADSPVALQGGRMRILVAAGSAEDVPGVLEWLEWGSLPLDLTMIGDGGVMDAPLPADARAAMAAGLTRRPGSAPEPTLPGSAGPTRPTGPADVWTLPVGCSGAAQGAAVWVRPPEPEGEVEASLPTLSVVGRGGGVGGAPDLVRVLNTVATQCHRLRLRRAQALPSAVLPRTRH
ncbi:SCO3374 family protein [Streptomyces sp. NPDC050287]|uniref:SCO3374 family protein n=1 Tax=Streptomyces sp. NPDC050287 TaxID=3365608 RepID=UPI0037936154